MDFVWIIRSIEKSLCDALTAPLFHSRAFWRCMSNPDWIIAWTDQELGESPGQPFTDLISPPIFLIIFNRVRF